MSQAGETAQLTKLLREIAAVGNSSTPNALTYGVTRSKRYGYVSYTLSSHNLFVDTAHVVIRPQSRTAWVRPLERYSQGYPSPEHRQAFNVAQETLKQRERLLALLNQFGYVINEQNT